MGVTQYMGAYISLVLSAMHCYVRGECSASLAQLYASLTTCGASV